ncbi:hypothetical protein D1007_03337 [Hordeum vulgare]|nr:hypothetical protein D1007_03337 [Hordeum vulgare]
MSKLGSIHGGHQRCRGRDPSTEGIRGAEAVRRRSDVAAAAEEEAAERGGEDDGLGGVEDVEERIVEEGDHDARLLLPPTLVRPRALHLHLHDLEPPERHGLLLFDLRPGRMDGSALSGGGCAAGSI